MDCMVFERAWQTVVKKKSPIGGQWEIAERDLMNMGNVASFGGKGKKKSAFNAHLESLLKWMLFAPPFNWVVQLDEDSNALWFEVDDTNTAKWLPEKTVIMAIISRSIATTTNKITTEADARNVMAMAVSDARRMAPDRIVGNIKPLGFKSDKDTVMHRLPFDLSNDRAVDVLELGKVMTQYRTHMEDYDPKTGQSRQFERLMSLVGLIICTTETPKSVFVWYGKGNDGKTALMHYLCRKLGAAGNANVDPDVVKDPKRMMAFLGRRLVHMEEPTHGKLITAALKRVIGSPSLKAWRLYRGEFSFENHAVVVFTTNRDAEIENSEAAKGRLVTIKSKSLATTERMKFEEFCEDLDAHFEAVLNYAARVYEQHGGIVPMKEEEFGSAIDRMYEDVDGWITSNLAIQYGSFVHQMEISLFIRRRYPYLNKHDVFERVEQLLNNKEEKNQETALALRVDQGGRRRGFVNVCALEGSEFFESLNKTPRARVVFDLPPE
jgi:hypothetical protein